MCTFFFTLYQMIAFYLKLISLYIVRFITYNLCFVQLWDVFGLINVISI